MRRQHLMRHNQRNEQVHNALWLDTETRPTPRPDGGVDHHLWFGWAAYARRLRGGKWSEPVWWRFDSIAGFYAGLEEVLRPKTTLYIYCHNSSFDYPVLDVFHALPQRGWQLKSAIIDAPPTILTWRRGAHKLVMLDTLNWWREPLRALGESLGVPKLDMPAPDAPVMAQDEYCRRDVEIIMAACLRWWEMLTDHSLGGVANTIAGQALRTYRHRYMQHHIYIHNQPQALELERASYHGGRTECFRIGDYTGQFYDLDVNSAYPAVMRTGLYPVRLCGVYRRPTLHELGNWCKTHRVVVRVVVDTPEPVYPRLSGGRLVFPVGRFATTLTTPELTYALEHHHVVMAEVAAVYDHAPLFREWVTDMYRLRRQALEAGDAVRGRLLKKLMNSLYGKFGQTGRVYDSVGPAPDLTVRAWDEVDAVTGQAYHWRQFGGLRQCLSTEGESTNSFPAIAAHITAEVRMLLWGLLTQAGLEHCYYCDTDALWVDATGYQRLADNIDPETLGALKVEATATHITIHGPKDYTFGPTSRTKGIRKAAVWVAPDRVVQDKWSGLRGMLRSGQLAVPSTVPASKQLHRTYGKGSVGVDGVVTPFMVSDE